MTYSIHTANLSNSELSHSLWINIATNGLDHNTRVLITIAESTCSVRGPSCHGLSEDFAECFEMEDVAPITAMSREKRASVLNQWMEWSTKFSKSFEEH